MPFADLGLVKVPDGVSEDQAIILSDIFPSAYYGAELAAIQPGDNVVVFGCGPVGLFTIASAALFQPAQIFAVDTLPDRLSAAKKLGALTIDFNKVDPVSELRSLTKARIVRLMR